MIRRWLRARRAKRPAAATDWCCVCFVDLPPGKCWDVHSDHQAGEGGWGGTYLSQTFCRRHKPKGAVRC